MESSVSPARQRGRLDDPSPGRAVSPRNGSTPGESPLKTKRLSVVRTLPSVEQDVDSLHLESVGGETPLDWVSREGADGKQAPRPGAPFGSRSSLWDMARAADDTECVDVGDKTLAQVLKEMYIGSVLQPAGALEERVQQRQHATSMAVLQHARPLRALLASTVVQAIILLGSLGVLANIALFAASLPDWNGRFADSRLFRMTALQLRGETDRVYLPPEERGAELVFRYGCSGICHLQGVVLKGFWCFGLGAMAVLSRAKRYTWAMVTYRVMCLASAAAYMFMIIFSPEAEEADRVLEFALKGGDWLCMGLLFASSGSFWMMDGVIWFMIAYTVVMKVLIERARGPAPPGVDPSEVVTYILFGLVLATWLFLTLLRGKLLLWGRRFVSDDLQRFEKVWGELLGTEGQALLELRIMANRVSRLARGQQPRQIKRQGLKGFGKRMAWRSSQSGMVPGTPGSDMNAWPAVNTSGSAEGASEVVPGRRVLTAQGSGQSREGGRGSFVSAVPHHQGTNGAIREMDRSNTVDSLQACATPLSESSARGDRSTDRKGIAPVPEDARLRLRHDSSNLSESPSRNLNFIMSSRSNSHSRFERDLRVQSFIHSMSIDVAEGSSFDGWNWRWFTSLFRSLYDPNTNNITSLDQLYAQARGMEPVLRVKARSWAIASNGTFRQAKIKSVERAVEKLLRSYREDVSRLLDVCRQSIVFESVKDLHTCLYHMILDPEVEIVRIKNRLDRNYNSFQSAGYRDVAVNLRIHSQDSMRLGLNGHVVEVLLVLQCFAKAVTPDSHKRYTEFRSVREIMEPTTLKATLISPLRNFASRLSEFLGASNRIMSVTEASSRHGSRRNSLASQHSLHSHASQQSLEELSFIPGQGSGGHRVRPFRLGLTIVANMSSDPSMKVASSSGEPSSNGRAQSGIMRTFSTDERRVAEAHPFLPSGHGDRVHQSPVRHNRRHSLEDKSLLPEEFHHGKVQEKQEQALREAALFEAWYLVVTTFPGRYMGNKLRAVSDAIGDTGSAQALFTARPVAAALRFVLYRILIFVMFGVMLFRSVAAITSPQFEMRNVFFGTLPSITPKPADVGFYGFRFTALGLRSGKSGNITSPHIAGFEVLQGGCAVLPEPARVVVHGASIEVHYNTSIKLDGVRITTSELGDPEDDPVQWMLEAEVSQVGSTPPAAPVWEGVASSNMKWTRKIQLLHLSLDTESRHAIDTFAMPIQRNGSIDVNTRMPLSAFLVFALEPLLAAMGLFFVIMAAVLEHTEMCARILAAMCLCCSLTVFAAGSLLISDPLHTHSIDGGYWLFYGLLLLIYAVQMAFYESYFVQWLPVSSVYLVLVEIVWTFGLKSEEGCRFIQGCNVPMAAAGLLICSQFTFFWKYWSLAQSKAMIAHDVSAYAERWQALCDASRDEIESLCALVKELDWLHDGMARQFNRKTGVPLAVMPRTKSDEEATDHDANLSVANTSADAPSNLSDGRQSRSWDAEDRSQISITTSTPEKATISELSADPGTTSKKKKLRAQWRERFGSASAKVSTVVKSVDTNSRVSSLDQLCAQATGVDPILRSKVQAWAMVSRGHFRFFDAESAKAGFVLWETASASEELKARIKWARLKKLGRAVEKLMRSYREDVSRLLDVCRQSIVFDTVADVTTCLQAIMNDPEVEIVRIKNRLDPNYNAAQSAGYRDLAMNLRICNEDTAKLGVDVHVCEVQLLVRTFAEIKNESGHKRYIEFRNRRGE